MNKRVLFVDDSASIREVVKYTLENDDFEVILCDNGEKALKCFDGQEISLLITDLHMPEMNGIELIKNIRRIPQYQKTPLLLLTTETQLEIIMEAKAAGATGWIIKPFAPSKLLDTIRKIIK